MNFRPISLSKCSMKIISKVLANRLTPRLHELVDPYQTGLINGTNILDGIVITQEVIYQVKKDKVKGFLFRLDFKKAYDRVNWHSIIEIFVMKFGARWCWWIRNWLFLVKTRIVSGEGERKEKNANEVSDRVIRYPLSFYNSS